ncbi:MAG: hypothetical protein KIT62_03820 [Cyclobacteriaceae bacterium]|nr:hypothetical protein [Cyclobacteriaceae bacterium]
MPFTGATQLFSSYHSFTTAGVRFAWNKKGKHAWEQSVQVGYLYHRFVQHSVPVFSEIIYRHNTGKAWQLRGHLGLGYLHSVPAADRFELNGNGEYEQIKNIGRAQGMVKISFSGAYRITTDTSLTANYGVLIQTPFVKSYVPLLPYNTLQLGVAKSF